MSAEPLVTLHVWGVPGRSVPGALLWMATELISALGMHRAWDRTPLVTNNAVPA